MGQAVSDAWLGYAGVLFLEFGRLIPADYTFRDGRPGHPRGEYTLTTMDSYAAWAVWLRGHEIATSCSNWFHILRALKLLVGRRLRTFEIDARSRSTRLTFSQGLELLTSSLPKRLHPPPHWILRLPSRSPDDWPAVTLGAHLMS